MSRIERIALLCAHECAKQAVGLDRVAFLLQGFVYGRDNAARAPGIDDLLHLAKLIEPKSGGFFRRTPVTFRSGGYAANPSIIPAAVERLFELHVGIDVTPEAWTKALLDIHPFSDGNGRTAFVLYNWLAKSFDEPRELPDFYALEEPPQ